MLIIPAVDIYQGKCVRLRRGEYASAKVYRDDPADAARAFADLGALWIHVVDLDAARGDGNNRGVIRNLVGAVGCDVEVGGGVRTADDVHELADCGVRGVIVGTTLARDPEEVGRWVGRYGVKLGAAIDADEGAVKVSGWERDAALEDTSLARTAAGMGVDGIIYTSIHRDGMLTGPDIRRTNLVARAAGVPVILSGGIGTAEDVGAVAQGRSEHVVGVITGKAVYEAAVDLAALFRMYQIPEDAEGW